MSSSTRLTPEQRKQRARIAAYARWSRATDPRAAAERGQAGLLQRFREQILAEEPHVEEPELTRRATALRREHMARLAFQSSKARTEQAGEADG